KDVTPQETILLFENEPLDFEPGQRYAYNNSGYVLLGALIERVTGSSYSEYLAKQIFLAAGLERTSYCATRAPIPPRAHGYSHGKAGLVNARYFSPTQGFAVGGICSTAPDLGKWLEALTTGRVVSPAGFTRMTTPEPAVLPDGETLTYGFGTGVGQFEGHPVLYHAGGIFGFDAMEAHYPRDDLTVVVLCNTDGDTAGDLENAITRLALQI